MMSQNICTCSEQSKAEKVEIWVTDVFQWWDCNRFRWGFDHAESGQSQLPFDN